MAVDASGGRRGEAVNFCPKSAGWILVFVNFGARRDIFSRMSSWYESPPPRLCLLKEHRDPEFEREYLPDAETRYEEEAEPDGAESLEERWKRWVRMVDL